MTTFCWLLLANSALRGLMSSEVKKLFLFFFFFLWINEWLFAWSKVCAHLNKNLTICNDFQNWQTVQLLPDSDLLFSLEIVICRVCLLDQLACLFVSVSVLFVLSACVSVWDGISQWRRVRSLTVLGWVFLGRSAISCEMWICFVLVGLPPSPSLYRAALQLTKLFNKQFWGFSLVLSNIQIILRPQRS